MQPRMSQLFKRKPIADLLVDEGDSSKSLKRVLGAGDLISEVALAVEMGADATDIGRTIHPHPTLGESVAEATVGKWFKKAGDKWAGSITAMQGESAFTDITIEGEKVTAVATMATPNGNIEVWYTLILKGDRIEAHGAVLAHGADLQPLAVARADLAHRHGREERDRGLETAPVVDDDVQRPGDGARERLAETPQQVLDRQRQRESVTSPAPFERQRRKKLSERGARPKRDQCDRATDDDEDGRRAPE